MSEALQVDAKDLKKRNTQGSVSHLKSKENGDMRCLSERTSGRLCILQNFTPFRNLGGKNKNKTRLITLADVSLPCFGACEIHG